MQDKTWYSILGVDTEPLSIKNLLLNAFEFLVWVCEDGTKKGSYQVNSPLNVIKKKYISSPDEFYCRDRRTIYHQKLWLSTWNLTQWDDVQLWWQKKKKMEEKALPKSSLMHCWLEINWSTIRMKLFLHVSKSQ